MKPSLLTLSNQDAPPAALRVTIFGRNFLLRRSKRAPGRSTGLYSMHMNRICICICICLFIFIFIAYSYSYAYPYSYSIDDQPSKMQGKAGFIIAVCDFISIMSGPKGFASILMGYLLFIFFLSSRFGRRDTSICKNGWEHGEAHDPENRGRP
jgi:hypothetical protein